eukprot:TRINITY_DN9681_c0_g1_i1.p1 TRINITY_DN9681_c0_g1~~TRINITY_DN9681_c0_g1_i1.p1  ORF type:complete len:175 (+),score=59.45 TRINITY_DN9681_c0_g1_i1:55-525(+)
MDMVFNYQLCSRPELDSHRYKVILDAAIAAGELKGTKAYRSWAAKVAKKAPPATQDVFPSPSKARKAGKGDKANGTDDLAALILGRQEQRSADLFASLEAKYGGGSKQKKQKKVQGEVGVDEEGLLASAAAVATGGRRAAKQAAAPKRNRSEATRV